MSLTPLTYQVLLALADEDRHGYGIIKEIEGREGPGEAPSTGALYLAVQRMEGDGLLEETPHPGGGEDARRRYYKITARGRALAAEESERLAARVDAARAKRLLAGGTA
jgi:DNA-binding PadR family transcriptional regulator